MFRLQVTIIRQTFLNMSCPCTEMSAWWWLISTETCSNLYIIEYIVVFLTERLFSLYYKKRDGSYKKIFPSTGNRNVFLDYSAHNLLYYCSHKTVRNTEIKSASFHLISLPVQTVKQSDRSARYSNPSTLSSPGKLQCHNRSIGNEAEY